MAWAEMRLTGKRSCLVEDDLHILYHIFDRDVAKSDKAVWQGGLGLEHTALDVSSILHIHVILIRSRGSRAIVADDCSRQSLGHLTSPACRGTILRQQELVKLRNSWPAW